METGLTKVNDVFLPMIEKQLSGNGIIMDGYSRQCVLSALSSINAILDSKVISWNDPQLDRNNLTQILMSVASLKLNAAASPREVYFQLRNVKRSYKDKENKSVDIWKKEIEMGIEGDGNDAILARFGRDVAKVGQFWQVREQDKFEYPQYDGIEVVPPKWTPTGKGDVVRVVYPLLKTDNTVEYYIAERDDVARNLIAHINNNLMNETFGICESRYKASAQQKKDIAVKKTEVLRRAQELGLGALDDPDLQSWISPAWTEFQSREQMIIRKMRNNVVKKIPKDFGNAYIEMTYAETSDSNLAAVNREIAEHANGDVIDITDYKVSDKEPEAEPEPEETDKPPTSADQGMTAEQAQREHNLPPTGTESAGPDF